MTNGMEPQHPDDALLGRLLRDRLPRPPSPPHLRATLLRAAPRTTSRPARAAFWMPPAAAAVAMALVMLLWIAPSLPTTVGGDPVRVIAHAVISEHARTILWGESRSDVV